VLSVTETNEIARRSYEGYGFVDTGERRALRERSELHTLILSMPL